jgi:hypothetical protein
MRNRIYSRPEKHIALVTHGAFLHYFTEDWTGYEKARGMDFYMKDQLILMWLTLILCRHRLSEL